MVYQIVGQEKKMINLTQLKHEHMRFLYGKVKARKGNVIRVTFSESTRILFMVEKEFNRYKNNLTFTYFGGLKDESPFDFVAPKASTWFVVVEKGSYHEPKDIIASISLVSAEPATEALAANSVSEDEPQVESETNEEEDE
jgi:hypothetical protein